jgi:hypothetical protein
LFILSSIASDDDCTNQSHPNTGRSPVDQAGFMGTLFGETTFDAANHDASSHHWYALSLLLFVCFNMIQQ